MTADDNVGHHAVRSAFWSYGAVGAGFVLQIIYTASMSRLLTPSDFGVVATSIVATQLIGLLARMGIASAVTQRESIGHNELKSAHGLSIIVGLIAMIATLALTAPLAALLRTPAAAGPIAAIGVMFFINSVAAVPEATLRRQFRFREISVAQIASVMIANFAVGVPLALAGVGLWSLVAANVVQPLIYALAVMQSARVVRPSFSREDSGQVFRFGRRVTLISVLEYVGKTSDNLAVSRWLGTTQAGIYSRAQLLVSLVPENLMAATARVLQPSLSRLNTDPERFSRAYTRALSLLALTVLAPVISVAVAAPAIVPLLLGDGWGQAVSLLPVLAVGYSIGALTNFHGIAAEAFGILQVKLVVQLVNAAIAMTAVAVVVVSGPSVYRFAAAWAFAESIRALCYMIWIIPRMGVSVMPLVQRLCLSALVSCAAALPLFLFVRAFDGRSLVGLCLLGIAGLVLAALVVGITPKLPLRDDIRDLVALARRAPG